MTSQIRRSTGWLMASLALTVSLVAVSRRHGVSLWPVKNSGLSKLISAIASRSSGWSTVS